MSNVPFTKETFESFTAIASLAWWIYVVFIILIFFGGLLLNYIVKKINDSRLETRLENLSNRAAANQATQIQRPTAEPDKSILPKHGISLVFNKEDNLLEDKRRKPDLNIIPPINDKQVNLTITENIQQKSEAGREEIMESVFLGSIYKELFENRLRVERSKSMSSTITRRDSIMSDIFNKMVWKKITESKSTPSVKKLCSMKSEEYLKERIVDLVRNTAPDVPNYSQLASPINQSVHIESAAQSDKNLPNSFNQQSSMEVSYTSFGCK